MDETSTWLVPVDAAPAVLAEVETVLISHRLAHQRLDPDEIVNRPADELADVVVLLGGPLQPSMLDVLRHMVSLLIPTLVIVDGLTDHQESLLLGGGAFDVVGLPSSQDRLTSRLVAIHRNAPRPRDPGPPTSEPLAPGADLEIYPESRTARVHQTPVDLTRTEFDLLVALARRPQHVLSRDDLSGCISGRAQGARALESHLSRLRHKLIAAGAPRLIEPVRGVGYRLGETHAVVESQSV